MDKVQDTIDILKMYNQEHIIRLLEKLDEDKKQALVEQISKIDFHQLKELYDNTKKEIEIKENKIEPLPYLDKKKLSEEQKEEFQRLGEAILEKGEYAVVTMAGGQGTRLGHSGPKGTFKLDVYGKGKYLFEILADKLIFGISIFQNSIFISSVLKLLFLILFEFSFFILSFCSFFTLLLILFLIPILLEIETP